jgi:membrane-associated protein
MAITALGSGVLDPQQIAVSVGLIGVLAIVFAECGLLIGFFLPGDSLLFAAGLLVAERDGFSQPLWVVITLISVAAIAGNVCGYWIGRTVGPTVFSRPKSRFFKPEYVERTALFFDRYGAFALIVARFTPIVRTIVPVMAGTGRMSAGRFMILSVVGGVLWATSMTGLGYWLGQIAWVQKNIEFIALAIVVLSFIPIALELRRGRQSQTEVR